MTSLEKLIKKFLENPSSLKYPQLEKILLHTGHRKIPAKGSHIKFKHQNTESDLITPIHNNDCKDFYKNLVAKHLIKGKLLQ